MIRSNNVSDCPALQQVQIDRSITPEKHSKGAEGFHRRLAATRESTAADDHHRHSAAQEPSRYGGSPTCEMLTTENARVMVVEAARLDEVPEGTGKAVNAAGKQIAVFNAGGRIYAIDDTCPHLGASLGAGKLHGTTVTCIVHGMKIDVTTGCLPGGDQFAVASYPVKILGGRIMVIMPWERAPILHERR
jgi:nitrite reductase/ring-hydroxylating ferredoxin subunit